GRRSDVSERADYWVVGTYPREIIFCRLFGRDLVIVKSRGKSGKTYALQRVLWHLDGERIGHVVSCGRVSMGQVAQYFALHFNELAAQRIARSINLIAQNCF